MIDNDSRWYSPGQRIWVEAVYMRDAMSEGNLIAGIKLGGDTPQPCLVRAVDVSEAVPNPLAYAATEDPRQDYDCAPSMWRSADNIEPDPKHPRFARTVSNAVVVAEDGGDGRVALYIDGRVVAVGPKPDGLSVDSDLKRAYAVTVEPETLPFEEHWGSTVLVSIKTDDRGDAEVRIVPEGVGFGRFAAPRIAATILAAAGLGDRYKVVDLEHPKAEAGS